MADYQFDEPPDRRRSDSDKWRFYGPDALPLWVADMDFAVAEPIVRALQERVAHGVFGYGGLHEELADVICRRLLRRYRWRVLPEEIVYLPGLVSGLNAACRTVYAPGAGVLAQTPVYPPFLSAPANQGLKLEVAELSASLKNRLLYYAIDYHAFEAAIHSSTRLFLLCNPHNPVGRCFSREELLALADICARRDLIICSDEIHCELTLAEFAHIPIAALSADIAKRCITLMAPSKTFNIAGLYCGFAVIQEPSLRRRFQQACGGIVPAVNVLGLAAGKAAYEKGEAWRLALLNYLTANRDFLVDYVREQLPQLRTTVPEGTFLAWLDCRELSVGDGKQAFFLERAKVALSDGKNFGRGGDGFVRLNFGCSRQVLHQALEQMRAALAKV